jgi:hypothetical protein
MVKPFKNLPTVQKKVPKNSLRGSESFNLLASIIKISPIPLKLRKLIPIDIEVAKFLKMFNLHG